MWLKRSIASSIALQQSCDVGDDAPRRLNVCASTGNSSQSVSSIAHTAESLGCNAKNGGLNGSMDHHRRVLPSDR